MQHVMNGVGGLCVCVGRVGHCVCCACCRLVDQAKKRCIRY